jgi:acetyltransferase-like isoleucine patch superfamily enzyme
MKHGKFTKWKWIPYYPKNIIIGRNVDIGALCFLQGKGGIFIEDNVQIGGGTFIYSEDSIRNIKGLIIIRKGVCIGAHSVILPKKGGPHIISENIKAGSVVY